MTEKITLVIPDSHEEKIPEILVKLKDFLCKEYSTMNFGLKW